jgi:hypothetical protein
VHASHSWLVSPLVYFIPVTKFPCSNLLMYNNNNNNKLYLKKVQLYENQFSNANLTLGLLFNCYRPLITNLLLKLHIKLDISTTSKNKSRTNK